MLKIEISLDLRLSGVTGRLPIVSTAKDAVQHASAEACIKGIPEARAVDKTAKTESPAPETSTGLVDNAGRVGI